MTIYNTLQNDLNLAIRINAPANKRALRLLKSSIDNFAIEKRTAPTNLSDNDVIVVIRKEIKKCEDALAGYMQGGRDVSASNEREDISILSAYLPKELSSDELDALISDALQATGASTKKQMGIVMKYATEKAAGKVSSQVLSAAIQKRLL